MPRPLRRFSAAVLEAVLASVFGVILGGGFWLRFAHNFHATAGINSRIGFWCLFPISVPASVAGDSRYQFFHLFCCQFQHRFQAAADISFFIYFAVCSRYQFPYWWQAAAGVISCSPRKAPGTSSPNTAAVNNLRSLCTSHTKTPSPAWHRPAPSH